MSPIILLRRLMAGALAVTLAACGGGDADGSGNEAADLSDAGELSVAG